jgi:hypothetical protein
MMMDEIIEKIIKNDYSQPDSTFRICDTDHEAELQHKKQTRKITM